MQNQTLSKTTADQSECGLNLCVFRQPSSQHCVQLKVFFGGKPGLCSSTQGSRDSRLQGTGSSREALAADGAAQLALCMTQEQLGETGRPLPANLQERGGFCCVSGGDKVFREGQNKSLSPFHLPLLLTSAGCQLPSAWLLQEAASCFVSCCR